MTPLHPASPRGSTSVAMVGRLAHAYSASYALTGALVFSTVGLLLQQQVLGVTRQPLPLAWPLVVVHVSLALLPLRQAFGLLERESLRAPISRAVRALVALLSIGIGLVSYVGIRGEHALLMFCLALGAVGFTAGILGRWSAWVCALGVGMAIVGLVFITPWGASISAVLETFPTAVAAAAVAASATVFIITGPRRRPRASSM